MDWGIHKGSLLDHETAVNIGFEIHVEDSVPLSGTVDLYSCNLDNAPGTIENERIEVVGKVVYTLTGVNQTSLPQIRIGRTTHYKIPLTLNIRLGDEAGHLVFRLLYKGEEVGKAEISITDD
ncbi:hypothetical protein M440DRAFT_1013941 [Trichoderma longibrachiatum ATCC 18648]|uniref:Uncharacterized protein n=1 Tax=Trichoderma longibrachiatum ATCC 18648 TaxID=983965 RepID=A0A2T4CIM0_TRILO|nr:hypothetical protein M440DRAFT_1013941 [Trichoderma longibrachiatum ATCC 18648]